MPNPIVSLKDMIARDPDMIILNRGNEREAVAWLGAQPGWNELRAVRRTG